MFKLRVTMAAVLAVAGVFGGLSASGQMGELLAQPPLGQQAKPKAATDVPPEITTLAE
jgi:hypothetical protein